MLSPSHIACGHCGTTNRVGNYDLRQIPRCGRCRKPLRESVIKQLTRSIYGLRWAVLVIGGAIFLVTQLQVLTSAVGAWWQAATAAPPDVCASTPQPDSGLMMLYDQSDRVAPLTLRGTAGTNYFVKLADHETGRTIMTLYMRGGETIRQRVPEGDFVLKYAMGNNWCDPTALFGATTSIAQTDRVFNFREGRGYTVELIKQLHGNLPSHRISRQQF